MFILRNIIISPMNIMKKNDYILKNMMKINKYDKLFLFFNYSKENKNKNNKSDIDYNDKNNIKKTEKTDNSTTVDDLEIDKFSKLAAEWWNPNGVMKSLHSIHPIRMAYIRQMLCSHFDKDPFEAYPLKGLNILDAGCGVGLATESLARLGCNVTGIDASKTNVKIAETHCKLDPFFNLEDNIIKPPKYIATSPETLALSSSIKEQYDAVISLEVIEHVSDVELFTKSCCDLVKDNGCLIMSTINRTVKSYLLAIIAAEYMFNIVPQNTHEYDKFINPQELTMLLNHNELDIIDITGFKYNIFKQDWSFSKNDYDINYILTGIKQENTLSEPDYSSSSSISSSEIQM
eukprot:TRINITY_DN1187_c0_g3_i2.p1 TRINITY_DN1187_c0_g3~~TRINITY_DN1187_c0_g3_i2.p1  ORF type:complete len:347 (+),score=72.30 TRINITY_DN1187_c0_g3_i2:54-1094(+)